MHETGITTMLKIYRNSTPRYLRGGAGGITCLMVAPTHEKMKGFVFFQRAGIKK